MIQTNTCEFGGEALIPVGEDVHVLVVVPGPGGQVYNLNLEFSMQVSGGQV